MANKKKHIVVIDTVKKAALPLIVPVKKDTFSSPSLFQNHLLQAQNDKPKLHFTKYDYLISGILLFLFVLFVWLYVANRKKLSQVIKGFYQTRFTNQNTRDEYSIGNRVSVFLSIFFIVTLTIFITQVLAFYNISLFLNKGIELIIALVIIITYGVKFLIINLLGFLFQVQKEARDYMMSVFLFCNALGLFMLPLVICLLFMKQAPPLFFIYSGAGIIVSFLLVRLVRGVFIGLKSQRVSKFYLFMYLCTLEILPFFLMVKLVFLNIR